MNSSTEARRIAAAASLALADVACGLQARADALLPFILEAMGARSDAVYAERCKAAAAASYAQNLRDGHDPETCARVYRAEVDAIKRTGGLARVPR